MYAMNFLLTPGVLVVVVCCVLRVLANRQQDKDKKMAAEQGRTKLVSKQMEMNFEL